MKRIWYLFAAACAFGGAGCIVTDWCRGLPADSFVWIFAIFFSLNVACHYVERLMVRE